MLLNIFFVLQTVEERCCTGIHSVPAQGLFGVCASVLVFFFSRYAVFLRTGFGFLKSHGLNLGIWKN